MRSSCKLHLACRRDSELLYSVRSHGVTGFVCSAYLKQAAYHGLLHLFNGNGVRLPVLTNLWFQIVAARFKPVLIGSKYRLFVADGINIPKEGRKMPAVKSLHNASNNNSKPHFVMGHSFQSIGLICDSAMGAIAVPLVSRIVEGLTTSNRSQQTLLDKFVELFQTVVAPAFEGPKLLVADAYYATGKVIKGLLQSGTQLITRVKLCCVAYAEPPKKSKPGRGRPAKYGKKVALNTVFGDKRKFSEYSSPVYGEENVILRAYHKCLFWRPAGCLVKFIWVIHPSRGNMILMSTDLDLSVLEIIGAYGLRFKIEVSFKSAIRSIGVYCYRFWSKAMTPIKRCSIGQFLHRESAEYRIKMFEKLNTYHVFVQVGCIAQGALQYLCSQHGPEVWQSFRGYLRTMRPEAKPSERVAALALQSGLPEFLAGRGPKTELLEILGPKLDLNRVPSLQSAA